MEGLKRRLKTNVFILIGLFIALMVLMMCENTQKQPDSSVDEISSPQ